VCFLGNLRRELGAAEADSHAVIYRRYALSTQDRAGDSSPSYELAKPRLRILLESESYPDYIDLQNRVDLPDSQALRLVFEPLVGDVIACSIDYKAFLQKDLAASGQDIYVASMTIQQRQGVETHFSAAVWSKGVDTILPLVDRIFFFESESVPLRTAAWEDVARAGTTGALPRSAFSQRRADGRHGDAGDVPVVDPTNLVRLSRMRFTYNRAPQPRSSPAAQPVRL
jgi:hypothetical protein